MPSLDTSLIIDDVNTVNLAMASADLNDNINIIQPLHHKHNQNSYAFNFGQDRSWLQTIIDSSHLITFCISISVIIYGSFRSLNIDKENQTIMQQNESRKGLLLNQDGNENEEDPNDEYQQTQSIQTIDSAQALFIPIAASISLLLMFFFFDSIQTAFVICTSILATVAFSFLLSPVCKLFLKSCLPHSNLVNKRVSCCFLGKFTIPELIAFLLSSGLVCLWIVTGHWLLMDLIGVGFCVTFIAIVRLPSLKVSTLLLVGLVVYDVIWVYFSHWVFNSNVMVKVATKEADNPVGVIARKLNMETSFSKDSPKLSLPGKLVVPSYQRTGNFSILGLGDIVVPGLLLCFVLRFDAYKRSQLYQVIVPSNTTTSTSSTSTSTCKHEQNYTINETLPKNNSTDPNDQQPKKINCDCLNCKLNDFNYYNYNRNEDNDINCQSSRSQTIKNSNVYSSNSLNSQYPLAGSSYSFKNLIRLHKLSYFHCSLIGYFVGLITATLSSEIFREAQPALLYLVPFTLLPLLTMAYLKGDLSLMWNEPFNYKTQKYFYI